MFPFNLNQASDTVNYMTEFRDEGHDLHPPPLALAAGHPTPFSGPSFFSILHDQGDGGDRGRNQHEESFNVSATSMMSQLVSRLPDDDADSGSHVKLSLCDHYIKEEEEEDDDADVRSNAKWMPSKIRFVRKTMNMDHAAGSRTRRHAREAQDRSSRVSNYYGMGNINMSPSGDDVVRVCSDCHTTKTPLWRSGPCGPKSLCNACGIRQRKARRAMAASAAATANSSRLVPSPPVPTKAAKEKKLHVDDRTVPFKKRCKFAGAETTGQPQLCFEDDVTLSLGTRATMATSTHRPFPQDERDAAILLMALSYGLVRS